MLIIYLLTIIQCADISTILARIRIQCAVISAI